MDEKTNDKSAAEEEASRPASPGEVEPPAASAPAAVPLPRNKYHWTTIALVIVSVAVFLLLTTLALGARAVFEHNRGRAGYGRPGGCDCCECPMRDRRFGKKGVAPPWRRDPALDGQGIPLPPQAPGSPTQSAPLPVPGK